METFTNLRVMQIPEMGITDKEIELILEAMNRMVAQYDHWPQKGTWQVLWQEEECEAKEIVWSNFAEGASVYGYSFVTGYNSGGGRTDTDRMVNQAVTDILRRNKMPSGIYERWLTEGVEDVLVLNTMEGRILICINTTTDMFRTVEYKNTLKGSEIQQRLRNLLIGLAEVMNVILEVSALYRLGVIGDTILQKSMTRLHGSLNAEEVAMAQAMKEWLLKQGISADEQARREKIQELRQEMKSLWREKIFGRK